MKRRPLLAAVGASAVSVAGCLEFVGLGDEYEWTHEPGSRHLTVSNGRVVGRQPTPRSDDDGDGSIFALEAETGERQWTFGSSDQDTGYAPLTVRDGIYTSYGSDTKPLDRDIYALEFDGTVRWNDVRGWMRGIDDGVAYVDTSLEGSSKYRLLAVETTDGERLWQRDGSGAVLFDRTERDGHETVYVDGPDLVALERDGGSVRWRYGHDGDARAGAVADGVVYMTTESDVFAVADGEERWRVSASHPEIHGLEAGRLLVEYVDRVTRDLIGLRALDVETGDERWHWEYGTSHQSDRTWSDAAVGSRDGVVYVGDDRLSALDAADGTERWSDTVNGDGAVRSVTVVDAEPTDIDHAVVVTAGDNEFGMYDPGGERFCSDDFSRPIEAVAVDTLAYVATDERVYAFDAW